MAAKSKKLQKFKEGEKFNWYDVPMVERARIANQLGKESSQLINKALDKARALLHPYGYTMNIDLHFCELPKTQENQAVKQES